MCISATTRFITSTGQGEPAMMPVRREDRSYVAKSGRFSSAMNMVGTPYSEVQRSCCDRAQGGRRVEGRGRDDHAGAVRGGREVAHHHAEAVVEGHRHADPVLLGVADQLADEVAVVEDVVVGEGGALGEARGARGVLDVDRVVAGQLRLAGGQRSAATAPAAPQQLVPARVADVDGPRRSSGQPAAHLRRPSPGSRCVLWPSEANSREIPAWLSTYSSSCAR